MQAYFANTPPRPFSPYAPRPGFLCTQADVSQRGMRSHKDPFLTSPNALADDVFLRAVGDDVRLQTPPFFGDSFVSCANAGMSTPLSKCVESPSTPSTSSGSRPSSYDAFDVVSHDAQSPSALCGFESASQNISDIFDLSLFTAADDAVMADVIEDEVRHDVTVCDKKPASPSNAADEMLEMDAKDIVTATPAQLAAYASRMLWVVLPKDGSIAAHLGNAVCVGAGFAYQRALEHQLLIRASYRRKFHLIVVRDVKDFDAFLSAHKQTRQAADATVSQATLTLAKRANVRPLPQENDPRLDELLTCDYFRVSGNQTLVLDCRGMWKARTAERRAFALRSLGIENRRCLPADALLITDGTALLAWATKRGSAALSIKEASTALLSRLLASKLDKYVGLREALIDAAKCANPP